MTTPEMLARPDPAPSTRSAPSASPLSTQVTSVGGGVLVVAAFGDIDLDSAPLLRAALASAVDSADLRLLVCDLSEVRFLDGSGLTVLLETHHQLAARGIDMRVVTGYPVVSRVLTITELHDSLGVRADLATALRA